MPSAASAALAPRLAAAGGDEEATDILEEWILHRRVKGDTLFEVSVGLAELEDKVPGLGRAFDRARYVTNVPQPSDLTPPMGPFPLARSASTSTILHHLLLTPPPTIEHSREVILEYVLAREMKARDKKPGRGGKGTMGRDGFEEISKRLAEVESGLGTGPEENRQIGLTLILSLRMSLSYFTLQELADELLQLGVGDAERILVQHIRRRVQGEGRYGVGKELELVEEMCSRRPALRPAFRAAKNRTSLPNRPTHQIPLPAPSKSACMKMLKTRDAEYALELVSEYIAREKREYMLKNRWNKSGRDQLGKDVADIETAYGSLIPVCLILRRSFALPDSPLDVDAFLDMLPPPPDPDDVPFREPTIQTTTTTLYVNPRLDEQQAYEVLEELVENERDKGVEDVSGLIDAVEKRFPDGSYAGAFARIRGERKHRRAVSTPEASVKAHARTVSVPTKIALPRLDTDTGTTGDQAGWWDVVSAVQTQPPGPLPMKPELPTTSPGPKSPGPKSPGRLHPQPPGPPTPPGPLPPGAEPAMAPSHAELETSLAKMELEPVTGTTQPMAGSIGPRSAVEQPTSPRTRLGFGRSVTLGKKKQDKTQSPGKWNREMVASIMGQPEKR